MSHRAPFTVKLKVTPNRGKRFETIRSLQRLAKLIYGGGDGLSGLANASGINMATPGGGQADSDHVMSDYVNGCAITPQFGESPAQLTLTGFYTISAANSQPHPDRSIINGGELKTGAGGAQPWYVNPTSTVAAEVAALKTIINNVITAEVPGEGVTIFRLDYKGIVWGDRGYTL